MKTNKNQLKEVSQILELEDNKVLIELYGQHDENLTKIENNFGIHIFKIVNNTKNYSLSNIGLSWYLFSKKV